MKEFLSRLRTAFLAILVVISVALGCVRLMTVQIVNGDNYLQESEYNTTYTQPIKAVRGQIVDYKGRPIVENKVGFNVIIDASRFPENNKEGNEILLETLKVLSENNLKWNDSIPISKNTPYEFNKDSESDVETLKDLINVNQYATAENCIDKLIDDYDISDKDYTESEQRTLAGIRYEMLHRDFSLSNTYTLCENVPIDVVTKLKELSVKLKGIDISEAAVREIAQGDIIPHEIGTVGPIYAEEYEELKKKGYAMNDSVGKGGIESAMEDQLRGEDGEKTINVTDGQVVSADVTREPKGGHSVKLTINGDYQRDVQTILENFTAYLRTMGEYSKVKCGAVVVLDVKDNSVLAMATTPTYNLSDYKSKYEELSADKNSPLLNRATRGLYRPGSTFKTITATAGLNEGIVTGESTYRCEHDYDFYGVTVGCTGHHNDIAVSEALRVSCNIYFYELSRHLGIDKLAEYAGIYGFGKPTGLETGGADGWFATPETFNELGMDMWTIGQVIQAGIGQSETAVTPLHMAVQASTIANRGIRYTPHLVDSIYDYSMSEKISSHEAEIADQVIVNNDYMYDYITKGMIMASTNNFPAQYSLSDLGFDVAIKTGTPQNWRDGKELTDTAFIGFAPANDPQIAFAGMVEGGEYSKYMIRSIIQAYYKNYPENGSAYGMENINFLPEKTTTVTTVTDENGNPVTNETTQTTAVQTNDDGDDNDSDNNDN